MINVLIPMAGPSSFFEGEEYHFPKALVEILGTPMIQRVASNLLQIKNARFIFILKEEDCIEFHIDDILRLLLGDALEIVKVNTHTGGATCSCLLAIELVSNSNPLIIINSDQIIEDNLQKKIDLFLAEKNDAGCLIFESIHPRWSYVKHDDFGYIYEASEKRPISKSAIAGFYFFHKGFEFVEAAMKSIENGSKYKNSYYISSVLNEYILMGKKVKAIKLDADKYHTFYSPLKIAEYEKNKSN